MGLWDEVCEILDLPFSFGEPAKTRTSSPPEGGARGTACSLCGVRSLVNLRDLIPTANAQAQAADWVCLDCFDKLTNVQDRIRNWAGGSKSDRLPGYNVEAIFTIKTSERHESIKDVEDALKLHTARIGGNAYVNFYWDRHREPHEKTYVAGYGPRGNSYYRTRRWTDVWYSGRAVAAHAVARAAEPRRRQEKARSRPPEQRSEETDEVRFRRILGLTGPFTSEELKKAYKDRMMKYHPDRVSDLGEEFRQLAEEKAKEINAAFAYFQGEVR